jgi:hypothetical protein
LLNVHYSHHELLAQADGPPILSGWNGQLWHVLCFQERKIGRPSSSKLRNTTNCLLIKIIHEGDAGMVGSVSQVLVVESIAHYGHLGADQHHVDAHCLYALCLDKAVGSSAI